jgi:hypothetical protein
MLRIQLAIILTIVFSALADEKIGVIVDNFNSRNWSAIYTQFSADLKNGIPEEQFKTSMDAVRNSLGIMQDYVTIDVGQLYFIC